MVTGRYAIARFNLEATGVPSHAGARLAEGRSAIREMARKIVEIEDMTTADCTFSVGVIHGGQWVNCVTTTCTGEALSMAKRQEDLDRGVAAMLALRASSNEVRFKVTRGVTRPVWEPNARRDGAVRGRARHRAEFWDFISTRKVPVADQTGILPARWECRRWMALGWREPGRIRWTSTS